MSGKLLIPTDNSRRTTDYRRRITCSMGIFAGTKWDAPPRCDRCGALEADCRCAPLPPPPPVRVPPEQQTARLAVENRSRGKSVTVVRGLAAADNDLPELLSKLKTACGAGGTLDGDQLELQGRHLDRVRTLLGELGYKTKG
ncbi:MAG: translation initiation factor [Pirellulales bacterium]